MDPQVDVGAALKVFIDPQGANSLGTIATDNPVAADAIRAITAAGNGKRPWTFREDRFGTASRQGPIDGRRTGQFSIEGYALPSGSAGIAPDIADLLLYSGWQATIGADTAVSGSGSTTTVIGVADASGLSVGGCVTINGETRRITAVTAGTPDSITVTPALSSAPSELDVVSAGIAYAPKDSRADAQDAFTAWIMSNRSAARLIGCVTESLSLTLGSGDAARIQAQGIARRHDLLLATRLNGALTSAATTVPVDNGACVPSDVSATAPVYLQVDDEVLKVTGVSGDNLTVATRQSYLGGGTAASHADNAVVYVYSPAGTYAGSPVPSTSGAMIVDGVTYQMQNATINLGMGVAPQVGRHGDGFDLDHYVLGTREVDVQAEGWTYFESNMYSALDAQAGTATQVFLQQGSTVGQIVAVDLPLVRFEVPDLDRGAEEVTISLSGQAYGTASGEDEAYIMFG